jgi:hypothetical protein
LITKITSNGIVVAEHPAATSSSSAHCYNWLEPPDYGDGVFATHPQVKTWFQEHLWIPDDGRINLAFEIQSIDSSGDLKAARKICTDLQEVCEELVKNRGRLLIVDNDCHGSNRLFGNLTPIENEEDCLWSTELSTQYRSDTDSEMSRLPIPTDVATIDIRQPQLQRQWRRLM